MEHRDGVLLRSPSYIATWLFIASVRNLDEDYKCALHIPVSGGRFLFTVKHRPRQCVHKYLPVRAGEFPGFILMATWKKPVYLHVFECSHGYLFYSEKATRALCDLLKSEKYPFPHLPSSWVIGIFSTLGCNGKFTSSCVTICVILPRA